jgi:hypothetical protein
MTRPPPLPGYAWSDTGEIVPVAMPPDPDACPTCGKSYDPANHAADALDAERQEAIRRLLDRLAGTGNLREVGWRCVLANWLCTQAETQAQLAKRIGVSPAAVSQSLNALRSEFGQCLQANGDDGGGAKLIAPTLV